MRERLPVQKVVPATEVRNKLGRLLNNVYRGQEQLVVEKMGIPVAAIISMREYEHYRRLLAKEMLETLGPELGQEAERQGLTEEGLRKEVRKARDEVFAEMYGKLPKP
ncbi:MAG: type II toxin-antitoxin system Phd/YefM family antitoxin [Chloroflexi bacterium]|nr:type II toxin-antitoxin system Phd/YefM family antitoxin [Chloroflexota bacterium]